MTPYSPEEIKNRMRAQRAPFFLAPLIPALLAMGMLISNIFNLWFCIALVVLILSTASFMRVVWQSAHYQDYVRTKEFRLLQTLTYCAVPVLVVAFALHFIL